MFNVRGFVYQIRERDQGYVVFCGQADSYTLSQNALRLSDKGFTTPMLQYSGSFVNLVLETKAVVERVRVPIGSDGIGPASRAKFSVGYAVAIGHSIMGQRQVPSTRRPISVAKLHPPPDTPPLESRMPATGGVLDAEQVDGGWDRSVGHGPFSRCPFCPPGAALAMAHVSRHPLASGLLQIEAFATGAMRRMHRIWAYQVERGRRHCRSRPSCPRYPSAVGIGGR